MFHTVRLSKSDPTPLYIQLASELSKLIQEGLLNEGMQLPTIRFLSQKLSINRDTVVSAYKLLESQGLVESHIGKGTYISSKPTCSTPSNILSSSSSQIHCSHLSLSKEFFPSSLCLDLTTEIVNEEGWEAFNDPLYRERQMLKHRASVFLEQLGIKHHYAQVRLIKSIDTFLLTLFKASPKTGICVEAIRDLSISCYLRSIGAKIYEVPLLSDGMDLACLEKYLHTGNIAYIFISSILQNPTGICYSKSCLKELTTLAEQYNVYIIDDISYASFIDSPILFPKSSTSHSPIIYLHHFSRLYLPYLSYSFAILPTSLVKRLGDETECSFNERLIRHYLNSPALATIMKDIHSTCKQRYHYFYQELRKKNLPLELSHHYGGLSFWLSITPECYDAFCEYLTREEIIISPGELFSTTPLKGYIRLSITNTPEYVLAHIIEVISYFFNSTSSRQTYHLNG